MFMPTFCVADLIRQGLALCLAVAGEDGTTVRGGQSDPAVFTMSDSIWMAKIHCWVVYVDT